MDNYKEEYEVLFNYLKETINNNLSDERIKKIYTIYLSVITENIDENTTQEEYLEKINLLMKIYQELKELTLEQEGTSNKVTELEGKIKKLQTKQNHQSKKITSSKVAITSYVLALSILIGTPLISYFKIKNTPREKLYKTYKEIHTTIDKDYKTLKPGYMYINANDVATYTESYEEKLPYDETIEIKEYSPWITEGTESERKVVTILKDGQILGYQIYERDLPDLVLGYGSHQEHEYKYIVEIPYEDRQYTEKIYEITRLVQNLNDYIEKDISISEYTNLIILLLTELLLWFGYIEISQDTLLAHLINEISKLKSNKNISKKQSQELERLYVEYLSINQKSDKIFKRKK